MSLILLQNCFKDYSKIILKMNFLKEFIEITLKNDINLLTEFSRNSHKKINKSIFRESVVMS